jgi:hypothetical protein
MRRVTISLPDGLYAELQEVSAMTGEKGYSPAIWAADFIASEMASRRLPRVSAGRYGARVPSVEDIEDRFHVVLPEPEPQTF